MAVGIKLWVAKFCREAFFKPLRDEMFQAFGFVVDFFEWVLQDFVEECLQQPMVANDLQRASHACGREAHSTVRFVLDELG